MEHIQHNLKQIDVARTFLSIVAGVLAGILGCKSGSGLLAFLSLYTIIAMSIAFKMNFDTKMYTNSTFLGFILHDLQKNGLSFINAAARYVIWIERELSAVDGDF
eukprot:gene95-129_t